VPVFKPTDTEWNSEGTNKSQFPSQKKFILPYKVESQQQAQKKVKVVEESLSEKDVEDGKSNGRHFTKIYTMCPLAEFSCSQIQIESRPYIR